MTNRYIAIWIALLAALFLAASQASAGTITGKVTVKGLRSPQNILVYLNRSPEVALDLSKARFIMDQKDLTFIPHLLAVPTGATVEFPNHDKVPHNVFSLSRTKKFNLGSYSPGEIKTVVFDKPGIVELRCDVHAEMAAFVMVMKNPYYGLTDKEGRFNIPDPVNASTFGLSAVPQLPAGEYVVKTRHEKLKTTRQSVSVPASGSLDIQLNLKRGTPGALYK